MLGEASKDTPPNSLTFDHCHTKKARTNTKANGAHIEINNYMPGANNPLTDRVGQRLANTGISPKPLTAHPIDIDEDDLVVFPSIGEAFATLHRLAPEDNWLLYETGLLQYGFEHVNDGEKAGATFLEQEVGMPPRLASRFQSHCTRMANRARKGKGPAKVKVEDGAMKVKVKEGDENNPISI